MDMSPIEFYLTFAGTISIIIAVFLSVMIPFIRQTSRERADSEARQAEALNAFKKDVKADIKEVKENIKEVETKLTTALKEVETKLTTALEDSETRQTTALEDSETRQTTALKEVETKLTTALKEVETKLTTALKDSETRQTTALKDSESKLKQDLDDREDRIIETLKSSEANLVVLIEKNERAIDALSVQLNQMNQVVFKLNSHVQRLLGHVFGVKELFQPGEEAIHTEVSGSILPDERSKRHAETVS